MVNGDHPLPVHYDGDDSDVVGSPAGPPGSDEIEKTFERYFDVLRLDHVGTDFDGLAVNTGAIAHSALTYAFSNDLPGPDTRTAPAAARTTVAHDHHHGGLAE